MNNTGYKIDRMFISSASYAKSQRRGNKFPRVAVSEPWLEIHRVNRFQKLVAEAKKNITEISAADAQSETERGGAVLIDVREDEDWREDHAQGAKHLNRGSIELQIEEEVADLKTPIICYCGGGSRSALVAETLQKMGYENVRSIAGGFRAWKESRLPSSSG